MSTFGQVPEAITGGDTPTVSLMDQIGTATTRLGQIAEEMKEAKTEDTARYEALKAELADTGAKLQGLQDAEELRKRNAEIDEAIATAKAWAEKTAGARTPSKAHLIGSPSEASDHSEKGDFINAVMLAGSKDAEEQTEGKAKLRELGLGSKADPTGKATLGTTDALGGWVVPNALVEDLIKPALVRNIYRDLMTTREGVTGAAVDLPFRAAGPNRAIIASFGSTKENVDLTYNGYTVTMYTLARIHDVANQFLRQSRGAAEQDVLEELATAFALGESYYIREGSGSSEPMGYATALTAGPATFRSTFSSPSDSTVAGSIAAAIAVSAGDLASRGETPTAAVLAAAAYWNMLRQGSDSAGFWFATNQNSPASIRPGTLISPFGIPVFADAGASKIGTAAIIDNLVVADWKAFKLFFGASYRVDQSSEAGERFDKNLTGFRGEEEMGFDARPAVYAGKAQQINDIIP